MTVMKDRKKIVAIPGSTKQFSTHLNLINTIIDLYSEELETFVFRGLSELTHYNPDLDNAIPPAKIVNFRKLLSDADGILICTPEYAMGVPGSLKNALDWTVSSMEFYHKPVALITASSLGHKGHQSLTETLKIIESDLPDSSRLLISYIKTKMQEDKIVDAGTLDQVKMLMDSFINVMEQKINLTSD